MTALCWGNSWQVLFKSAVRVRGWTSPLLAIEWKKIKDPAKVYHNTRYKTQKIANPPDVKTQTTISHKPEITGSINLSLSTQRGIFSQ
jgi:hypothetical protein